MKKNIVKILAGVLCVVVLALIILFVGKDEEKKSVNNNIENIKDINENDNDNEEKEMDEKVSTKNITGIYIPEDGVDLAALIVVEHENTIDVIFNQPLMTITDTVEKDVFVENKIADSVHSGEYSVEFTDDGAIINLESYMLNDLKATKLKDSGDIYGLYQNGAEYLAIYDYNEYGELRISNFDDSGNEFNGLRTKEYDMDSNNITGKDLAKTEDTITKFDLNLSEDTLNAKFESQRTEWSSKSGTYTKVK